MSTKVAPLGLRLFLEGVEVPVISASVTVNPDQPANAAIQVIPTDMGLHLLPRTLVHLFYLDGSLTDDEVKLAQQALDQSTAPRVSQTVEIDNTNRYDVADVAYKILFAGEVIGLQYQKRVSKRQMVLQCMDLSSYWDTCYQFFSDYSAGGNGLTDKHHNFVGANEGLFDNFGGHQWVLARLLRTRPQSPEYRDTKGLLGGLIHLLESVGGIRYRDDNFPGYSGVNDFFTIAELRYNLLGMLGAIEGDLTSVKLFSHMAFNQWLRNGMTSMGSLVTFRDILNHLNRYIFHNIYPNPCAHLKVGGEKSVKRNVKIGEVPFAQSILGANVLSLMKRTMGEIVGVIGDLSEGITTEVVEVPVRGRDTGGLERALPALRTIEDTLVAILIPSAEDVPNGGTKIAADLREVNSSIVDSIKHLTGVESGATPAQVSGFNTNSAESLGIAANRVSFENHTRARDKARDAFQLMNSLMSKTRSRFRVKDFKVTTSSHLYNQLFLPEAYFAAPPKCNVIFPDQYNDLQYSRNFLRETSRFAMQGGLGMAAGGRRGAKLLGRMYLAPNIQSVRGSVFRASLSQGSRVILPHEIHSGIVPKMGWVPDGHRYGIKAASGSDNLGEVKKSQKIHYLQRLANFQFFLHRWSARQLSLAGKFNPNIVAGLPAIVLDRSMPAPEVQAALEETLGRPSLPVQYLAKIQTFTHNITQEGGQTSVGFIYARTHRGLDDELLGIMNEEVTKDVAEKSFVLNPFELANSINNQDQASADYAQEKNIGVGAAAKIAPNRDLERQKSYLRLWIDGKFHVGKVLRGFGKITKVVESPEVSSLTKRAAEILGITDFFEKNHRVVNVSNQSVFADPNQVAHGATGFQDVKVVDLPGWITITYVTVVGTGTFKRGGEKVEDVLRPGWFSADVWSNENITEKVYKPLLGTAAITDDKSISAAAVKALLDRTKITRVKAQRILDPSGNVRSTDEDDTSTEPGAVDVQTADGKTYYTVVPGSVEEAIDGLTTVYSMIKNREGDVHEFIDRFTVRPIANLVQVLGSQNLEFNDQGRVVDPETMIEGFHSRAFGDYNTDVKLPERENSKAIPGSRAGFGLMDGVADPFSLKRPSVMGSDEPTKGIRPELDPRGRARGRVRAYVEELQVSKGLLAT